MPKRGLLTWCDLLYADAIAILKFLVDGPSNAFGVECSRFSGNAVCVSDVPVAPLSTLADLHNESKAFELLYVSDERSLSDGAGLVQGLA